MKHTVESLMALADAYAEISAGSTTAHAVEMQEALRAALAEALKERDALKLDAERYRELLCYHFAEIADLLGVAYGNYTAEGDIKNGIDKHLDEAMKGAA